MMRFCRGWAKWGAGQGEKETGEVERKTRRNGQ